MGSRTMRFSIRYQLLLPLLALMLGLVGASPWSAWASGQRARRQIESQIDDIDRTLNATPYVSVQILHLLKGLTGADFLLCDTQRQPVRDADKQLVATIHEVPDILPAPEDAPTKHFDKPIRVGGVNYLCGALPVQGRT